MSTEDNNQAATEAPEAPETEAKTEEKAEDVVTLSKAEYDKLQQDLGSTKRELKSLKKPKETEEKASDNKPAADSLVQKTFLRAAGISDPEEVDLALTTSKKWDMPIDALVDDVDFKEKLEKHRTKKANEAATTGIKGNGGKAQANQTEEYWIAKGTPPTAEQVPDRKVRAAVMRKLIQSSKSNGKTFYND